MTENNRPNRISSGEAFIERRRKLNFLLRRNGIGDEAPHGRKSSDFQLHAESDLKSIKFYYVQHGSY